MAIEQARVRGWLTYALQSAYELENVLFREHTHERSIVFHVARHLAAAIDNEAPDYAVDVDYDRWHRYEMGFIKKRLYGLDPDNPRQKDDVYPDIIVHRRVGSSDHHNVLVVEAKKRPGTHVRDRRKLKLFQEQLKYHNAVLVILGDGHQPPQWEWISEPGSQMMPAF